MAKIFVYGTLKRNESNHGVMKSFGGTFLCEARTSHALFDLIDLGYFPGLIAGHAYVSGELFKIDEQSIPHFDGFEGVPVLYKREEIEIDAEDGSIFVAIVYIYNEQITGQEKEGSVQIGFSGKNTQYWIGNERL